MCALGRFCPPQAGARGALPPEAVSDLHREAWGGGGRPAGGPTGGSQAWGFQGAVGWESSDPTASPMPPKPCAWAWQDCLVQVGAGGRAGTHAASSHLGSSFPFQSCFSVKEASPAKFFRFWRWFCHPHKAHPLYQSS